MNDLDEGMARRLEVTQAVADPGFAKGGTMASARSTSLNGGLGAEPPAGSTPLVGGQGHAESFLYIFIQKSGQKLRI